MRSESLEPRLVLDGYGLGVISPDHIPTISLEGADLVGNVHVESLTTGERFDAAAGDGSERSWTSGRDSYLSFESPPSVPSETLGNSIGRGTVLAEGWQFDRDRSPGGDTNLQLETRNGHDSPSALDAAAIDPLLSQDSDDGRSNHYQFSEKARLSEFDFADRGWTGRGNDRGMISLPDPGSGFLPADLSPAPQQHAGSIASVAGRAVGSSSRSMDSAASDPIENETVAQRRSVESSKPAGNAGDARTVALSRDHYFANHQSRQPVAWTTGSGASQARQHVTQSSHSSTRMSKSLGRADAADHVTLASLASWGSLPVGSEAGQVLVSAATKQLAVADLPDQACEETGLIEASGEHRVMDPKVSAAAREIRDFLFAQYQPLTVLVGVSILSAHLIADREPRGMKERGLKERGSL